MNIEDLMELVEGSAHGYYYTHNNGLEIMYGRGFKWRIRPINQGEWQNFTIDQAVELFNKKQLDFERLHISLNQTLLNEAVYMRGRLETIEANIGTTTVDKAVNDWEAFGVTLKNLINKTFKKDKIKLVKED